MKKLYTLVIILSGALTSTSQNYEFQEVIDIQRLPVILQDQTENLYYKVKNSCDIDEKRIPNEGFVYMSTPYLKTKATTVLVHKDALQKETKKN